MYPKPDYIQELNADGTPAFALWFGVPGGLSHLLPLDTAFDMIYSPMPYSAKSRCWRKMRYRVVERLERYGKHKGEWSRFYIVEQERELGDSERDYYTALIDVWAKGQAA